MIKQTLLTGWHFMRWLRLGLGLFIAIQAVKTHDTISGFIAAFFLFQAVTNTGCCGANSCTMPTTKKDNDTIEDVEFIEIKNKQANK
jgi:hypothetical protein